MSLRFRKKDYELMAHRRKIAFQGIARRLGKDHEITKMMGGLAWGRSNFETPLESGLQDSIREMSALDGAFSILNLWARDHDTKAQRVMLDLYPNGFESSDRQARGSPLPRHPAPRA